MRWCLVTFFVAFIAAGPQLSISASNEIRQPNQRMSTSNVLRSPSFRPSSSTSVSTEFTSRRTLDCGIFPKFALSF